MFGLFKKKSEAEMLRAKYKKLMGEYYKLSKIDRTQSDMKYAAAMQIDEQLKKLDS